MRAQTLFAHKLRDRFFDFFTSAWLSSTCTSDKAMYMVTVVEDPAGEYWTWYDAEDKAFHYTASFRQAVEICFPYGTKHLIEKGEGELLRVRLEVVRALEPHEYQKSTGLVGDRQVREV